MMNYGRDYGNRNFLDRAANTVRGWLGNRGHSGYDDGYRGMSRGYDNGYREMGDVSGGYRGWQGGMEQGYGSTNWTGRNPDWNRGMGGGGGWGHGGSQEYRTGGYQPQHGAWDVDWDDRTVPQGGMNRGGMMGGMSGGMMGSGRYDRGYMDRPMNRGMTGRGMSRDYDRDDYRGGGYRQGGGMGTGGMGYATGMPGGGVGLGDADGGTIGNYGAYGNYGLERFRSGSAGGVPTGQYWTGYGHGSGYR
jgi:hypothetical protein